MARSPKRRGWLIAASVALLAVAALVSFGIGRLQDWRTRNAMLALWPDEVQKHPDLVRYGVALGQPAYGENCASCHAADLTGDKKRGAPNLGDKIWLYDQGQVSDIEKT